MKGKMVTINRKARHDYNIMETCEAGLALKGGEVKSLREARVNLRDSFARFEKGEAFLYNLHISPWMKTPFDYDPRRTRKLLLHRREINRLTGKVAQKNLALIPLKLYFNPRGIAKVELGLARGKKLYDKRETLKKKAMEREVEKAFKGRPQ